MKKILWLFFAAAFFACSTSKSTESTELSTSSNRLNLPDNSTQANFYPDDTVTITGTQYLPILGRSETGTTATLEGIWELQTLNSVPLPNSGINAEMVNNAPPPGTEIRRDSVTTTDTINGVAHTVTEVQIDRMGNPIKKITPPQGSNYHIPAKPSLNFYGSNETFAGFTGCNKIAGRYTISDSGSISFQNATASTKMVCIGDYDEEDFLNTLRKITKFKSDNKGLQLLEGDKVLMVFSKKQ